MRRLAVILHKRGIGSLAALSRTKTARLRPGNRTRRPAAKW
jgi:hypothetical protein